MIGKKIITKVLVFTMLSLSTVIAFADSSGNSLVSTNIKQYEEVKTCYNSWTGTVKEISDFNGIEGAKFIITESEDRQSANLIVNSDTYVVDGAEITVGSVVTAYYDANAPMIMIYPPQYQAEVVVVDKIEQNIKVDSFDEDLVSSDNSLKLKISDDIEIILEDGSKFEGDLANRKLVVLYGISTKSIPAQTTPTKIIVLNENEVIPDDDTTKPKLDVADMDIIVNNHSIDTLPAFAYDQNDIMVPVRDICEALGYEVSWDEELQRVTIGNDISLSIGNSNYIDNQNSTFELRTIPVLLNGSTYVPLDFFNEVLGISEAYVSESQIIVKSAEITK